MRSQFHLAVTLALCALAACVSPQTARPHATRAALQEEQQRQSLFVLEQREREQKRVYDIGDRLLRANAELCPERGRSLGLFVENINDYRRAFRRAARTLWELDETPRVAWVGVGGPAENAGVRVGDRLLAVNGAAAPPRRRAGRDARKMLHRAAREGDVTLELQRDGVVLELTVAPQDSCDFELDIVDDDEINAYADGENIVLFRGMMRFVRSDDELALTLGHELAHNALRHPQAGEWNARMGQIGGAALDVLAGAAGVYTGWAFADFGYEAGALLYSQAFESEADYVGLYFARRAGFGIDGVEEFWRRMAAEHPQQVRFAYTHPTSAQRFLELASAREEIRAKEAEGQALLPNLRPSQ